MEVWNKKLITAAQNGDIEDLELSLQNGADIDYQGGYGETALMFAAEGGHLEICRLLIDRGCKIDITTEFGDTALMFAAEGGHLEICRLLIDTGCKIDITSDIGETALMKAVDRGHLEICRLLIDTGCKIDITSGYGYTALHHAAERGYLQITRCLVEQGGASSLIKTHKGKTPYDLAAKGMNGQYKEVMEYLQTVMSEKSSGVTAGQGREDKTYSGIFVCTELFIDCIVDSRLEETTKEQPCPESFVCDGIFVDCIVSKHLQHRTSQVSEDKDAIKTTDALNKLVSLTKVVRQGTMEDLITKMQQSIDNTDEDLAFRYILGHSRNSIDNVGVLHLLIHAINLKNTKCANAVVWEITRRFARTVLITQYHDIWPAFKCECKTNKTLKDVSCSAYMSNIVIVAEVYNRKILLSRIDSFHGIEIIYKEVNGQSKEAMCIVEYIDGLEVANTSLSTIQGVSTEDAKKYFANHSKLSLFSKSHLKSKGYGNKNSIVEITPCIQLFCRAKGLIPIGESHFPVQIDSIKTDILEGYPQLMANNIRIGSTVFVPTENEQTSDQNIQVNDQTGQARSNNLHEDEQMDIDSEENPCEGHEGTVGGFIKYYGEDAFLTCAHVVLNQKCLVSSLFRTELHENPVKVYCRHGDSASDRFPCGQLACFAFPPDTGMGSSIDAAIIKIDQANTRIQLDEREERELKSKYLQHCCLDWRDVGVHHDMEVYVAGSVSKRQNTLDAIKIIDERNVEFETLYQAVSKVYNDIKPAHLQDSAHFAHQAVKTVSDRQSQNPGDVIFFNQIAMHKLKFEQGDSGMCIYVRNRDQKLWCIGMAIATHPAGGCIITPLNAILKHFNF